MSASVKYVAALDHVREISLVGAADFGFWKQRLEKEQLEPQETEGKAQILIVGAEAKFRGIRFRELSFSVMVRGGMFLVRAFNSNRFFAFCERVFFSTPYYGADVRISVAQPAFVRMAEEGEGAFEGEMKGEGRGASSSDDREWEGPVFLPGNAKAFVARIGGELCKYPFLNSQDVLTIKPGAKDGVFEALLHSNFSPTEWIVRQDAAHAKSKTYKRNEIPPS
jgi:hypothetical protein